MTRNYGVNKEYAVERALAHTRKHGAKHICMVYQKVDFDGTMEVVLPNPNQMVIELDEAYQPLKSMGSVIKSALGIGVTPAKDKEEVIPF